MVAIVTDHTDRAGQESGKGTVAGWRIGKRDVVGREHDLAQRIAGAHIALVAEKGQHLRGTDRPSGRVAGRRSEHKRT